MSGLAFFDSNILLYTDDDRSPIKQTTAQTLFARHFSSDTAVLSVQVLQEYYSVATRKLGVSSHVAQRKVEVFAAGRVVRLEGRDVVAAIELHRRFQLSFWDALIVHAASCAGASVLYTEDLQPGAVLANVLVVNPFA
jgi:predicted nucleic acid-binding protein